MGHDPGEEWGGRKPGNYEWFEIQDEVAYFAEFSKPKIIWQAIQYNSNYTIDTSGYFIINKAFAISNADPWLAASLASPAMWWFNWRHFGHMKDEALSNDGVKSVHQPIPPPSTFGRDCGDRLVSTLSDIARSRQQTTQQLRAWYAAEWGLTSISRALGHPFALDAAGFTAALRAALPAARRRLSSAAIAAIQAEHADTVAPMAQRLAEAVGHERTLSDLVNQAFGLTPEDVALMWKTAPPRMPIPPPG